MPPEAGGDLVAALAQLARDARASAIADEVERLRERLAEGRYYVVCLGQFKRGKSTLLNAFLGAHVLPVGAIPVTSTIVVIRHGVQLAARVRFQDRGWEECEVGAVAAYVTEEHNPANEKGVAGVELFVPSPLLEFGMCLVDTPGIGSVVLANTEATRAFVPHVDAALLVLGADPPITGEEIGLVRQLGPLVRDIVPVFNKVDRQPSGEVAEAIEFTRAALQQALGRPPGPFFQVSAAERLQGTGPPRDWPALIGRLESLGRESGAILAAARARETRALVETLQYELDEQHRALVRPIRESERAVAVLGRAVDDAERSLQDLAALLNAEQDRLARRLDMERERVFHAMMPTVAEELRGAIRAERVPARLLRSRAMEHARRVTEHCLVQWREELEPRVDALYREAEQRFVMMANEFRARLIAVPGLQALAPIEVGGFSVKSRFHYTDMLRIAPVSPLTRLLDALLPWRRRAAIQREALEYQRRLMEVNSARIKNDFQERVTESRRRLEGEIRHRLRALAVGAHRALENARHTHATGKDGVTAAVVSVERLRTRLGALRAQLQAGPP